MAFEPSFDLEGIDELSIDWSGAIDELGQDLAQCTVLAAEAAISEMQGNHPYTDRTYLLSGGMYVAPGRQTRYTAQSFVRFKAKYAGAVEEGVEGHSRPYPFVPQGMKAADATLHQCMSELLDRWCTSLARK